MYILQKGFAMKYLNVILAASFIVCTSTPASALLITFEGESGFADSIGQFIDVAGFRFTLTGGNGNGFEIILNQQDIIEPNTTKLFGANHAEITMTKIGGGAFDLLNVDIGGSFVLNKDRWASSVDITDGNNILNVFLPPNDPTYQTANPNFLNLTSVSFIPFVNTNQGVNNYEYTLDNIEVADATVVTPEPSSLISLLALGTLGAASTLKRKQK
jgi:hypothetical protein